MKKVIKDIFSKLIYTEKLHNDLPFLPERIKIEKVEKLVANFHDKTEYVIHIKNLKQALNHGLVLKKVHRMTKFNQNAWLKLYIDMDTDLRKKARIDFENIFFTLMNTAALEKLWKMWQNIDIINLSQKKEEETIWCQNQIIIIQKFSEKIY